MQGPGSDQLPFGHCCAGHEGSKGEDGEAGEEESAATEEVAGSAEHDQQASERERVAHRHQLQPAVGDVKVGAHRWQGDDDDGGVDDQRELHHAQEYKHDPRATVCSCRVHADHSRAAA